MACCLLGIKPLSEPMLSYFTSNPLEQSSVNFNWNCNLNIFIDKMHLQMSSLKYRPSCLGLSVLIASYNFPWIILHWSQSHLIFKPCDWCGKELVSLWVTSKGFNFNRLLSGVVKCLYCCWFWIYQELTNVLNWRKHHQDIVIHIIIMSDMADHAFVLKSN